MLAMGMVGPQAFQARMVTDVKSCTPASEKPFAFSRNTMQGPDSISALACKVLGEWTVGVLCEVQCVLMSSEATDILAEACRGVEPDEVHAFSRLLLCCLPKRPRVRSEQGEDYFRAEDTRPLIISNVDNRLIASAGRLAWEPLLETWVSQCRRGFLPGRMVPHNVIEAGLVAMRVALKCPKGTLVLLDFRAASPSVSDPFLRRCSTDSGLPKEAINLMHAMCNSRCVISVWAARPLQAFALKEGSPRLPSLSSPSYSLRKYIAAYDRTQGWR